MYIVRQEQENRRAGIRVGDYVLALHVSRSLRDTLPADALVIP